MKLDIFIEKIRNKHVELERKNWSWSPFYNGALEAFSILQLPKHETVQQWEKRTGETYSDSAPCYLLDEGKYHLMTYAFGRDYFPHSIFVANHHGKPQ